MYVSLLRLVLNWNMTKFRVVAISIALILGIISPASAADKVGSLSGSRDDTTGLITAT